jgi:hypothetical protein
MPLLQACNSIHQVQMYMCLLRDTAAEGSAASSGSSSSRRGGEAIRSGTTVLEEAMFNAQLYAGYLLSGVCLAVDDPPRHVADGHATEAAYMLAHPVVPAVLLQLLAAWAMLLHREHNSWLAAASQQQQQQQQQPALSGQSSGSSSSSSSTQQGRMGSGKQRFRADLLQVPAFHLGLPLGSESCLNTAAALNWDVYANQELFHRDAFTSEALNVMKALQVLLCARDVILSSSRQQLAQAWSQHLLSKQAMQLVLEVQLLAAGLVQRQRQERWQQQQQQQPQGQLGDVPQQSRCAAQLLVSRNTLLHAMIQAVMQLGYPGMAHATLQQWGLQLLQALAAPVQQLLLCLGDASGTCLLSGADVLQQQLYALRAALSGFAVVQHDDPDVVMSGEH